MKIRDAAERDRKAVSELYYELHPERKGEKRKGDVGSAPGKIEDDSPGRRGG